MATKHAGTDITPLDFIRAAGRGEIVLRAVVHIAAMMAPLRPKDKALNIPVGGIATLPLTACQHLAAVGRTSWRHGDGHEATEATSGEIWRFERWKLNADSPSIQTVMDDCRVTGHDIHALADAFIETSTQDNLAADAGCASDRSMQNDKGSDLSKDSVAFTSADFAEFIANTLPIDWPYWLRRMKRLSPGQAARLMNLLNPDEHEDISVSLNQKGHSVELQCSRARSMVRLALNHSISELSPREWQRWALANDLHVEVGFERKLEDAEVINRTEAAQSAKTIPPLPSMYSVGDLADETGASEEEILDLGVQGEIVFLVPVPGYGACKVTAEALSYILAGGDEYIEEGLVPLWGAPGPVRWQIKRDKFRVLSGSWDEHADKMYKLGEMLNHSDSLSGTKGSVPRDKTARFSPNKQAWVERGQALGINYVGAWRKAGYDPTVADASYYVEAIFIADQILNTRSQYIDRETIKREALTGLTGKKAGTRTSTKKIPLNLRDKLPTDSGTP